MFKIAVNNNTVNELTVIVSVTYKHRVLKPGSLTYVEPGIEEVEKVEVDIRS